MQKTARTMKSSLEARRRPRARRRRALGGRRHRLHLRRARRHRDDPAAVVDGAVLRRRARRAPRRRPRSRRGRAARLAARPRDAAHQPPRLLHGDRARSSSSSPPASSPTRSSTCRRPGALPGPFTDAAPIDPVTGAVAVGLAGFPFGWAFDVSAVVAPGGPLATILQSTVGFMPRMSWLQVIAWVLYVAIVGTFFVRGVRRTRAARDEGAHPLAATLPRPPRRRRRPAVRRRMPWLRHPLIIDRVHSSPARSRMTPHRPLAILVAVGAAASSSSAASRRATVGAADALTVTSTDSTCDVSAASATSGTLSFDVSNAGQQVSEFYLLAEDGLRIVGEAENIAPGASRTLTVVAQPGDYFTLCKPGMVGEGDRQDRVLGDGRRRSRRPATTPSRTSRRSTCTRRSSRTRSSSCCRPSRPSSPPTSRVTTLPRRRSSLRCAPTTSASSRSPSRSATSTRRSTTARSTPSPKGSTGRASTASRRISGCPRRTR